ncbi:WhiB family transcriptional regulator [Microbacterium proteolyticum]|uniref:WhiB family transcriptional regulator n=1 Tax=Microbacterium proteolyticum TaxID=1572644 RepID=UPI003CCD00D2
MGLSFALVEGRRMVREDVLLAFWRERMQADPVHQARIARDRLQDASGAVMASVPPRVMKRRQAGAPRRTAAPRPQPAPDCDPLANVAPMRGAREFAALRDALRDVTPSCDGVDTYTDDRPSGDDVATMARICASCPVEAACEAYAVAGRPTAGYWPTVGSDASRVTTI